MTPRTWVGAAADGVGAGAAEAGGVSADGIGAGGVWAEASDP